MDRPTKWERWEENTHRLWGRCLSTNVDQTSWLSTTSIVVQLGEIVNKQGESKYLDTNIHIFCTDKHMVDRKVTVSSPRFACRQVTMSLPRTLPRYTTRHDNQKHIHLVHPSRKEAHLSRTFVMSLYENDRDSLKLFLTRLGIRHLSSITDIYLR